MRAIKSTEKEVKLKIKIQQTRLTGSDLALLLKSRVQTKSPVATNKKLVGGGVDFLDSADSESSILFFTRPSPLVSIQSRLKMSYGELWLRSAQSSFSSVALETRQKQPNQKRCTIFEPGFSAKKGAPCPLLAWP